METSGFETVLDDSSGTAYTPVTDGHSVGFRVTQPGQPPACVYLSPSTGLGETEPPMVPNVFVYLGPGTDSEDDEDLPVCHIDVTPPREPLASHVAGQVELLRTAAALIRRQHPPSAPDHAFWDAAAAGFDHAAQDAARDAITTSPGWLRFSKTAAGARAYLNANAGKATGPSQ